MVETLHITESLASFTDTPRPEQLGRRAFVMEIDPHYVDAIISRWEKKTGLAAERADNGGGNLFKKNSGV